MVDYKKSVIYKLCCDDTNIHDIYVGSTTNFTLRKSQHKGACNNPNNKDHNYNVYKFIRENGGWTNWDMVEIERYIAIDKRDLHKRERYWLENLGATLNKNIPSRTKKESRKAYYQNNKEELLKRQKEYKKAYYQNNQEEIKEKIKEKIMCDCGSIVNKACIARHKRSMQHIADFILI